MLFHDLFSFILSVSQMVKLQWMSRIDMYFQWFHLDWLASLDYDIETDATEVNLPHSNS